MSAWGTGGGGTGRGLSWHAAPTRSAVLSLSPLPAAAGAPKKTYCGSGRSAAPESAVSARSMRPFPAHALRGCAAIPGSRKSCNAHNKDCAPGCAAPEIALRSFRSATAGSPQYPSGSPPPSGAWSAACLQPDRPGRMAALFQSAFLHPKNRQKTTPRQSRHRLVTVQY